MRHLHLSVVLPATPHQHHYEPVKHPLPPAISAGSTRASLTSVHSARLNHINTSP